MAKQSIRKKVTARHNTPSVDNELLLMDAEYSEVLDRDESNALLGIDLL